MAPLWAGGMLSPPSSPRRAVHKMLSLASSLKPKAKVKLVDEIPSLPTVVLDLDGTLVHALTKKGDIDAAKQSSLTCMHLPGNLGVAVLRPGVAELFQSLAGYNIVVYSAGASLYVNAVVERLAEEFPYMQGKICKVLRRPDLVTYNQTSALPSGTPIAGDVQYVKDLRKARADGNSDRVLIVDDNPFAFQVQPAMKDVGFKNRYDFVSNSLEVTEFDATDPRAENDSGLSWVCPVLQRIAGSQDILVALKSHIASI